MEIRYATLSKTGRCSNNEDAFRVTKDTAHSKWVGIVCDGMGGHAMGEVASKTVSNKITEYWDAHKYEADTKEKVFNACTEASTALDERAKSVKVLEMGTTMVMASIENDTLTIAHIGDSRCYVQRPLEGVVYQTSDHTRLSFGWEVVTKCFFSFRPEIAQPDVRQFKLQSGDRILLCSDGLYKSMAPEILKTRMMDDKSPGEILDVFDFLCEKSGDDNYTAILVFID